MRLDVQFYGADTQVFEARLARICQDALIRKYPEVKRCAGTKSSPMKEKAEMPESDRARAQTRSVNPIDMLGPGFPWGDTSLGRIEVPHPITQNGPPIGHPFRVELPPRAEVTGRIS